MEDINIDNLFSTENFEQLNLLLEKNEKILEKEKIFKAHKQEYKEANNRIVKQLSKNAIQELRKFEESIYSMGQYELLLAYHIGLKVGMRNNDIEV